PCALCPPAVVVLADCEQDAVLARMARERRRALHDLPRQPRVIGLGDEVQPAVDRTRNHSPASLSASVAVYTAAPSIIGTTIAVIAARQSRSSCALHDGESAPIAVTSASRAVT